MSTVPAFSAGRVTLQAVVVQDAATVARTLDPDMIRASSADPMGRNPAPCTVTLIFLWAGPDFGDTLVTLTVLSRVADWWHRTWVSPARNTNHRRCDSPLTIGAPSPLAMS